MCCVERECYEIFTACSIQNKTFLGSVDIGYKIRMGCKMVRSLDFVVSISLLFCAILN